MVTMRWNGRVVLKDGVFIRCIYVKKSIGFGGHLLVFALHQTAQVTVIVY